MTNSKIFKLTVKSLSVTKVFPDLCDLQNIGDETKDPQQHYYSMEKLAEGKIDPIVVCRIYYA